MTLVVEVPPGRHEERAYVLDVVLTHWLGLRWRMQAQDRADVRIGTDGDRGDRAVTLPDGLFATADRDWLTAAALPVARPVRALVGCAGADALGAGEHLPVLSWSPGAAAPAALVTTDPGRAQVRVDVLGSVFFLLTRYEELVEGPRDRYGRFPAVRSVAAQHGFLRTPLVDAYVELLWAALRHVWPGLRRRTTAYEVLLTHDVDDPLATLGRTPRLLARQFAGDVVYRRDLGVAARRARAVLEARRGERRHDPNNTFDFLMDTSERHGLRSAFYFLSRNEMGAGAPPCNVLGHPWVRGLVGHVHRRGHEVGLHAGFGTHLDAAATRAAFDELRAVAAEQGVRQQTWGGRQHYLQWVNPVTWRNWDGCGLDYDCTVGYSDDVGFRTGTCREYPVFDLLRRRPLRLRERPFHVMDVTLAGYLSLPPDRALDAVLAIARECRRYRGALGILWHNDEVLRTARQKRWYASLVEAVTRPG